jgi:hypothetical protein
MAFPTNYTDGHYDAVWNSLAIGNTDDGYVWEITHKGELLRFEEYGENIIDLVHRGADVAIEFTVKEWLAAAIATMIWPWSATFGRISCTGNLAIRGGYAKPLVMTAKACSPAGTDGPATITFHKTILDPEVAKNINLNNKPRVIPIRMRCFLDEQTPGDDRYFTIT